MAASETIRQHLRYTAPERCASPFASARETNRGFPFPAASAFGRLFPHRSSAVFSGRSRSIRPRTKTTIAGLLEIVGLDSTPRRTAPLPQVSSYSVLDGVNTSPNRQSAPKWSHERQMAAHRPSPHKVPSVAQWPPTPSLAEPADILQSKTAQMPGCPNASRKSPIDGWFPLSGTLRFVRSRVPRAGRAARRRQVPTASDRDIFSVVGFPANEHGRAIA